MKIRIKKIPTFTFGKRISEILEGCELTVQTGEEDSSFFLQRSDRRLGNAEYAEFDYLDVSNSIRKNRGEDAVREFNRRYTEAFGLMSLSKPVRIKIQYIEIVQ